MRRFRTWLSHNFDDQDYHRSICCCWRPRGLYVSLARIERLGTTGEEFCCWGRCIITYGITATTAANRKASRSGSTLSAGATTHRRLDLVVAKSQCNATPAVGAVGFQTREIPQTLLILLSLLSKWPMHCRQFGGLTADSTLASIPIVPRNVRHAAWNWGWQITASRHLQFI